ncbi:hypothetical protein Dsin_015360 [Dipteronia sinensis]|uniref:CRM domain-containing protein n=1 Tax=Dipteronia sinensis TaxID=43782 RepID=A0AAE0AB43_9ROSI|nr:hypothetical protein Dsin_015360 [Dipteronia sinensis]
MALKLTIPFPIFVQPPTLNPNTNPNPSTEVRFSRWNNAHYEKFNQRQRAQQEIEDEIRRHRRFDSATKIAQSSDSDTVKNDVVFRSTGTPSSPSKPSIPGRKSKYSKPQNPDNHPAFRSSKKPTKITNLPKDNKPINPKANISISEDGVSYVIDGAPFEFKYSYTETPKVKPLKLREAPYAPFGPTTMPRPWTGRAPLPPSKKKLKEFDSFQLPPADKKGVKPVQKPGPFLPGTGPRYVYARDQLLGEPLTKEEVEELVHSSLKSSRQLNMGRDGLTHNMLDNIHALWKRRRVCKIKCKGVCTVDMDNVCQQLEERTGGKIIHRRGGVLYLFRGRNYNYKTRPRFPLMLWKPVAHVYPRLIQHAPEGLTVEEASEMRKKGRKLIPICKLGKNGVYCNLVRNVKEAFEECELVRINCQGMNGSDYRKIGAKLKDLVPCVLISFECEHILMWRGQDWKSSLPKSDYDSEEAKEVEVDGAPPLEGNGLAASCTDLLTVKEVSPDSLNTDISPIRSEDVHTEPREVLFSVDDAKPLSTTDAILNVPETKETTSDNSGPCDDEVKAMGNINGDVNRTNGGETMLNIVDEEPMATSVGSETILGDVDSTGTQSESAIIVSLNHDQLQSPSEVSEEHSEPSKLPGPDMEKVLLLMKQAVESGSAIVLDDAALDADTVYERSVDFAKSAPPGPVFRQRFKKVEAVQKGAKKDVWISEVKKESEVFKVEKEAATVSQKRENMRQISKKTKSLDDKRCLDLVPQGSLRVDELAKLLA